MVLLGLSDLEIYGVKQNDDVQFVLSPSGNTFVVFYISSFYISSHCIPPTIHVAYKTWLKVTKAGAKINADQIYMR